MQEHFDLIKANELIYQHYCQMKYDPEEFHQIYSTFGIPDVYDPAKWVYDSDTIVQDFARMMKRALVDIDEGLLDYIILEKIVRNFTAFPL